MSDISLRIKELIELKKMNISSFEKKIGAGNNSIGTIITKNTNVSGSILSKILNSFTDVNIEYLLTGKGTLLKVETESNPKVELLEVNDPGEHYKINDIRDKLILMQEERIECLKKELEECVNEKKILTNNKNVHQ